MPTSSRPCWRNWPPGSRTTSPFACGCAIEFTRSASGRKKVEHWAREALFVDVMNEEARGLMLAALRAQKKEAEVEKLEARYR